MQQKLTKTSLQSNWELENISGNEESTIFDRSFDILDSEIEVLVFAKKVKKIVWETNFHFSGQMTTVHIYTNNLIWFEYFNLIG